MATVAGRALDGGPHAGPRLTGIGLRASVTVVAGGAVRQCDDAGASRRRVAGPGARMALIRGRADDRRAARAGTCLAGLAGGAGIAVAAGGPIGDCWVRAHAGEDVALPLQVARVGRRRARRDIGKVGERQLECPRRPVVGTLTDDFVLSLMPLARFKCQPELGSMRPVKSTMPFRR